MSDQEAQPKPIRPFASLAQARRFEDLVKTAVISQAQFDAGLLVTDVEHLQGRLHAKKPTDNPEPQEEDGVTRARLLERQGQLRKDAEVVNG